MQENMVNENGEIIEEKTAELMAPAGIFPGIGPDRPTPSLLRKLMSIRKQLADSGLEKGGKNEYSNFSYFELADFLPTVNRFCDNAGILCKEVYDIPNKNAYMIIFDADSDGYLIFNCPLGGVDVKGAQGIQQMGALQTYARRYLYLTAFEIAESDSLDAEAGKEALFEELKAVGGNIDGLCTFLGTTKKKITAEQLKTAIKQKREAREKMLKAAEEKKAKAAAEDNPATPNQDIQAEPKA